MVVAFAPKRGSKKKKTPLLFLRAGIAQTNA
jgi:hypothetical protein